MKTTRPLTCKTSVAALFVALSLSASNAATLLQWNTFGNTGTETSELSIFNDANLGTSTLTLGAGVTAASNGNRFGGNAWFDTGDTATGLGTTLAESIAGNDYIEFIVTPNALYAFDVTDFAFRWDRSGTGPQSVALRSSIDSFATDLMTASALPGTGTFTSYALTGAGLTGITTATTFRLYGFHTANAAGTGGFDTAATGVNVQLDGATYAIPEPSRALLLGIGGLGLIFRRRRQ
jgi:hypothetical protein